MMLEAIRSGSKYSIVPTFHSAPSPPATRHFSTCLRFLLALAANQRFGVAFEIIDQNAHRARRAGYFLQRIAQILLRRRVFAKQCRVAALEHAIGRAERAAHFIESRR